MAPSTAHSPSTWHGGRETMGTSFSVVQLLPTIGNNVEPKELKEGFDGNKAGIN